MKRAGFSKVLFALMVASAFLFSGEEARANFTNFCYMVDNTASFSNDNSGVFTYHFSPVANCNSNTSVKNVLFEVPYDVPLATLVAAYNVTGTTGWSSLTCTPLGIGVGDSDTRLGVGDPRYNVLKCNSPVSGGFPKDYSIRLSLANISVPTGKKLSQSTQVVQLKSGNSLSDSDVTGVPSLVDVRYPPPAFGSAPSVAPQQFHAGDCIGVTLSWSNLSNVDSVTVFDGSNTQTVCSSNCQNGSVQLPCPAATTTYIITAIGPGGTSSSAATVVVLPHKPTAALTPAYANIPADFCIDLAYSSRYADLVAISPTVGVLQPNVDNVVVTVCPTDNTTYILTASGPGGTATATSQIDVGPPPPPAISLARKTIEKIGSDGTKSYITTYEKNDVPTCSCVTGPGEFIPEYPCEDDTLPAYCKPVTTTDQKPMLVCLTFLETEKPVQTLKDACAARDNNGCAVLTNVQCTDALGVPVQCAAYCDLLVAVTNEMSMQTGSGTCCTTTSKKCQIVSGRQICQTVYTTGPCEVGGTCP